MGQICCAEERKSQGGNTVEVEAMSERVLRSEACGGGNAVSSINSSSRQVSQATLPTIPTIESKPTQLWDDEGSEVNPEEYENRTSEKPFAGHLGLGKGPFCAQDAHRAGFYSVLNPPNEGDEVVCFQSVHWLKRGIVTDVDVQVSTGKDGLKEGHEGAWVTVQQQDGSSFQTWAAFLSTASENEYSSVCLQAEYENSNFHRLRRETYGSTVTHETRVTKSEARASLEKWLKSIVDADGEEVAINPAMHKELLEIFDNQQDASLHLYSLHKRLGPRTDARKGRDYSLYYQALNNTLNNDTKEGLQTALPLIRRMTYLLLYDESTGKERLHEGGTVWKGDSERPVPLNMQRLKLALRHDVPIRFRQFQSTTSDYKVAARFQKREDNPGFLWTIEIPSQYFGARNIQDVSSRSNESETLFPPYSSFRVLEVSQDRCRLEALPWVWEDYSGEATREKIDLELEDSVCVSCCV